MWKTEHIKHFETNKQKTGGTKNEQNQNYERN